MPLRLTYGDLVFSYSPMTDVLLVNFMLRYTVVRVPKLPVVKVEDDTDPSFRQIHLTSKGILILRQATQLSTIPRWQVDERLLRHASWAPQQLGNSPKHHETSWNIVKPRETSWNLVKPDETSWNITKHHDVTCTCHPTPSYPETLQILKFNRTINQSNSNCIFQTLGKSKPALNLSWRCMKYLSKIICLKLQLDT